MFQNLSGLDWTGHGGHFPKPVYALSVRLTCKQQCLPPQLVSVKLNPAEWIGMTRWLNKEKTHIDTHAAKSTHTHVIIKLSCVSTLSPGSTCSCVQMTIWWKPHKILITTKWELVKCWWDLIWLCDIQSSITQQTNYLRQVMFIKLYPVVAGVQNLWRMQFLLCGRVVLMQCIFSVNWFILMDNKKSKYV